MQHFFRQLFLFSLPIFFILSVHNAGALSGPGGTGTPCNGTIEAGVCIPTNTGLSSAPVVDILKTFMYWLLSIVGMLAIIAFVISGMQYLASVGDAKVAETAKKNMLNAIIGVVVALSGFVILQAIDTLLNAPQDNIF